MKRACQTIKIPLLAFALWVGVAQAAFAKDAPCPLPGQSAMLVARLYFGDSSEGRNPVSGDAWRSFLSQTVTPRFPQGFTVYYASGQWMDPRTHAIGSENTRVVEIATRDTPAARDRLGAIARFYRDRFRQQSVGVVTVKGCGVF